jgi:hypothetical protein
LYTEASALFNSFKTMMNALAISNKKII